MCVNKYKDWQNLELVWYRENGQYPERIKTTLLAGTYLIGDFSWNRNCPEKQEFIEQEMSNWVRQQLNIPVEPVKSRTRNSERRDSIINLRREGKTLQEIGDLCQLSGERVRQMLEVAGEPKPLKVKKVVEVKLRKTFDWKGKILALDIGESFLYDGRITPNILWNTKAKAKQWGIKVHAYKLHGGRMRVTRFS